jgi:hypothetical protein
MEDDVRAVMFHEYGFQVFAIHRRIPVVFHPGGDMQVPQVCCLFRVAA